MNKFKHIKLFLLITSIFLSLTLVNTDSSSSVEAQEIPELHMLVLQGDIFVNNLKSPSLDGLLLEAKVDSKVVASTNIGELTSSRYSGFEIGPLPEDEGSNITFWIGNERAIEETVFGQTTPQGTYCQGCTWSLPISRVVNLHFQQFPLATPTPIPDKAAPTFITGNLIFGSMLSAPEGFNTITALIDGETVGTGSVEGPLFSITIDPGTVDYIGKEVVFMIGNSLSKTSFTFEQDGFITDFKLFFPTYVAPTPVPVTPTVAPVPTATSTPEPTRTPTPLPEPTATYTPTATPTPIVFQSSMDSGSSDGIIAEDGSGGCNSRGGGAASLSLIILSAAPLYILNRRRRNT